MRKNKTNVPTKKTATIMLTTTAMLIVAGVLIPQAFHLIPMGGKIFLPMHLPVLLCGILCGPFLGGVCGILTPVFSWAFFGMPVAPNGLVPMVFELCAYGSFVGFLYSFFTKKTKSEKLGVMIALPCAMILGRIVALIVKLILLSLIIHKDAKEVFIATMISTFVTCWPGIVFQLFFIPALIALLDSTHILNYYKIKSTDCKQTTDASNDNK